MVEYIVLRRTITAKREMTLDVLGTLITDAMQLPGASGQGRARAIAQGRGGVTAGRARGGEPLNGEVGLVVALEGPPGLRAAVCAFAARHGWAEGEMHPDTAARFNEFGM